MSHDAGLRSPPVILSTIRLNGIKLDDDENNNSGHIADHNTTSATVTEEAKAAVTGDTAGKVNGHVNGSADSSLPSSEANVNCNTSSNGVDEADRALGNGQHPSDQVADDAGDEEQLNANIPEIELLIRASTIDGRRKGACLFCQEYFMDLYLLAELKTISLKITTVDLQKPPPDFRSNFDSTPPPILVDGQISVLENERIERYIMKNVPGGYNLFVSDRETALVIENLYSKFKLALTRNEPQTRRALLQQLRNINDHLERRSTRFLTGNSICCFDCELMPRLQHIRVAGAYLIGFEIPEDMAALWRYMSQMYNLDAFTQSCPADQDIINHYKQNLVKKGPAPDVGKSSGLRRHEQLETPSYTTSIPVSLNLN